jgi:uncharacterized protein YllA (UPF0747 family)
VIDCRESVLDCRVSVERMSSECRESVERRQVAEGRIEAERKRERQALTKALF